MICLENGIHSSHNFLAAEEKLFLIQKQCIFGKCPSGADISYRLLLKAKISFPQKFKFDWKYVSGWNMTKFSWRGNDADVFAVVKFRNYFILPRCRRGLVGQNPLREYHSPQSSESEWWWHFRSLTVLKKIKHWIILENLFERTVSFSFLQHKNDTNYRLFCNNNQMNIGTDN